jgi:hypothetical protein
MLAAAAPCARADEPPAPATQPTITVEQYQQLLKQQEEMRKEIQQLKAERANPSAPQPQPQPPPAASRATVEPGKEPATVADIEELDAKLKKLADETHHGLPGTSTFTIAGDAAIGFTNQRKTNSTFSAGFAPVFLFAPTDRLLFEAAADIGISTDENNSSSTSFDLTIANASYLVSDHLIVGGGLFVVPFGQYHNHFDPPWINKLPDDPLVFSDGGLSPGSQVGLFVKGVVPAPFVQKSLPNSKITYDLYLTNGPNLITNDPEAAGQLNFDDFTDLNNGKAIGGRIAFLPRPNIEIGYSIQYAQTSPSGFPDVRALLQAVDFNWVQECRPLGGIFTTRAEWVWSNVEDATYDPDGSLGFGPTRFSNNRNGGYVMLAYRPTLSESKFLRDTEYIIRYDTMRSSSAAPGGDHEQRYTLGIDYWITPSWVLKAAYQFDDKKNGPNQNAFYVQMGIGL